VHATTWPPELQEPGAQSMPAEVDSGQYLPAGQATQDDFVTSGMRPAAHSEHKPAPAVLYIFEGHGVTPVMVQEEPAGHVVQVAAPPEE